jgi:hypothetical protein
MTPLKTLLTVAGIVLTGGALAEFFANNFNAIAACCSVFFIGRHLKNRFFP